MLLLTNLSPRKGGGGATTAWGISQAAMAARRGHPFQVGRGGLVATWPVPLPPSESSHASEAVRRHADSVRPEVLGRTPVFWRGVGTQLHTRPYPAEGRCLSDGAGLG